MNLDADELQLWQELVAAVHRAVGEHAPSAARTEVNDAAFTIDVHPRREDAAPIAVSYAGTHEIYLEVGLTDAWIWQIDETPLPETLYRIVSGVMAGNFEEVGSFTAAGRVRSPEGDLDFGAALLAPLPWGWRRRRQYAPYA